MRVFITGTGRCGSVTCYHACRQISNYTAGHETHTHKRRNHKLMGNIANWEYPDWHIEVSPQLAIAWPILQQLYPDSKWIHLWRQDRDATARSLFNRSDMRAFAKYHFLNETPDERAVAYAIYDTISALCNAIPGVFILPLEGVKNHWQSVWDFIGAEGNFARSLAEWNKRYNVERPNMRRRDCHRYFPPK